MRVRLAIRLDQEESEEYGMEYAAFGPGPGAYHQDVRLEEGVLYTNLKEEASTAEVARERRALAALCQREAVQRRGIAVHGACMRYANIFGDVAKVVGKVIKRGWSAVKKVWKSAIRKVSTFVKRMRFAYDCGRSIGSKEPGYGGCDPLKYVGIEAEPAY